MELRKRSQEEQEKTLLSLYGIGPASVGYIMFDVFHHWDYFKHISPWEQKIYSKIFFDRDPEHSVSVKKLLSHFKRYHPYEQLAVHYLWENLWWTRLQSLSAIADGGQERQHEHIPWLEELIRT